MTTTFESNSDKAISDRFSRFSRLIFCDIKQESKHLEVSDFCLRLMIGVGRVVYQTPQQLLNYYSPLFFIEHLLSFLMDGAADFPLYCRGVYLDSSPTPQLTPPLVRVVTLIYQLHTLALDLLALLHIILKCIFQQQKLSWLQKIPRSSKCLGVLLKYEPLFQRNSLSFIFYQGKHKNIYKSSSVCVKNSMQRKELAGIYVYLCLCLYLLCKFIVGRNLIFLG